MIPALFDAGHRSYFTGEEDAHGNVAEGWSSPVVKKFITWADMSTAEPAVAGQSRDVVETGIVVYPPGANVPPEMQWFGETPKPQDRIVIDGEEYEVVGKVIRNDKVWWNSCDLLNWVINLKQVNG